MMLKEIRARVGSISSYAWYILPVFCWYFLDNRYNSLTALTPASSLAVLLNWAFSIVIVPFLLAGVFGGIHARQQAQGAGDLRGFFKSAGAYYWRMLAANLLGLAFFLIVTIVGLATGGFEGPDLGDNKPLLALISIPYSAISLFWFAAIVVERRIFAGLFRSLKVLLSNPLALAIGIAWGAVAFADNAGIDFPGGPAALALDGLRAAVMAILRILAVVYALAVYRQARGEVPEETSPEGAALASSGDGLVNASLGFSFLAFLPVFNLVALILGVAALKRKKRFVTRAAVACCVGGFFTIFYALLIAGWLAARAAPSTGPEYAFLAEANAELQPQALLLEQGSFQEVRRQLEPNTGTSPDRHWAFDSALALTELHAHDLDEALEDFQLAAGKKPERSEFYYYYGIAFLENHQEDRAAEQFRIALQHGPRLEGARRYLDLIEAEYTPSRLVSALSFVVILLFLFTVHEYGHAFVAWKLGDDTAQKLGRLTLNPLRHLDPFGSIILPAILLWQQSGVIFGWAKPVPVNPANFKDPRKDHMRVSFAGPAVNLIVGMAAFVVLGCILLFVRLLWPGTLSLNFAAPASPVSLLGPPFAPSLVILVVFLKELFYTSLVLGCFNLLPIPPLDGSWIFSGLLPGGLHNLFEQTRRFGFAIFLLVAFTHVLDYFLGIPIGLAWGGLEVLSWAMGFG